MDGKLCAICGINNEAYNRNHVRKLMKEQLKGRSGSRVEGLLIWIFAVGKGVWGRGGGGCEEGRGLEELGSVPRARSLSAINYS